MNRNPVARRFIMKTISRYIVMLLIVAAITGCTISSAEGAPSDDSTVVPVVADTRVVADGKIVPHRSAQLSFQILGQVKEIRVSEGDMVEAGDILILLDDAQQAAAVAQAEAALQEAQAALARLKAGARAEEVAAAQAAVAMAEANLAVAQAQVTSAQGGVTVAEGRLAQAKATLADLEAGATPEEREIAKRRVEMARNELWAAQAARDAVGGAKDRGQAKGYDLDQAEAALGVAYEAHQIASLELARIEANPREGARQAAQAAVRIAEGQLAQAASQVTVAQKQLQAAQAALEQARAQAALVEAGPTAEEVARAEAAEAQATAALQAARVQLDRTVLRAPFAGLVAAIYLKEGEAVAMGTSVVSLADHSAWYVETDDLTEMEVVRISVGQEAVMVPDALPEVALRGTVEAIRPMAEVKRGDTTYTVRIALHDTHPQLLWGMNGMVTFAP